MISPIYGYHNQKMVVCDNCGDGFEADSYQEAQEQMKRDGWKTKQINNKSVHYCGECAE